MNIKNLVCAAVVAFCVLGCASGPRFVTAKDCPGNSCDIAVSVVTGSDGKPRIVLEDNGNLRMGRGNRDTVIVWQLKDSPDYKFERDTIAPHTGAPVADKQTTSREAWNDQITFVRNSAVNFIV